MSFVLFSLSSGTAELNDPRLNLATPQYEFTDRKLAIDAASKAHGSYLLFERDPQDRLIPDKLIIGNIP